MTAEKTIFTLWFAWLASWVVAMLWSGRTEKRDALGAELFFRVLLYASVMLLFAFFPPGSPSFGQMQLWRFGDAMKWIWVRRRLRGFCSMVGSAIHLGRLWSDRVVNKAGHHVVEHRALPAGASSGDLFGVLFSAAFATAIEKGTSFALLGPG